MNDKLLEVSMMLGDAIKKLDNLSAYKPDPYAELKEAQERGEVIQVLEDSPKEMWLDLVEPEYYHEPEFYRIKPKEKKKLYLWAYKDKTTKSWKLTDRYMESAEDVEQDYLWIDDFQRIDSSMIEVDA
jgi:hypothetical protein